MGARYIAPMKPKGQRAQMVTPTPADTSGSYIVRLYRCRENKNEVVGVVESIADNTRHAFVDRDELWKILMGAGDKPVDDPKLDQNFSK